MCEWYTPCKSLIQPPQSPKKLSILILDYWQRQYDVRPYRHFQFHINEFVEKMERDFDIINDFQVMVEFLEQRRNLHSAALFGVQLLSAPLDLMERFALSLDHLRRIELKGTELPDHFFVVLRDNAKNMRVRDLNLEGTPLNDDKIANLCWFIVDSKIRRLNLKFCSITQYNFVEIADAVHRSPTIRSFRCSRLLGGRLTLDTDKIAHTVSSLIWQNKLQLLEMRQCEFIGKDMDILGEYLARPDSKMRALDLSYNIIGPDGTKSLLFVIMASNTLTHLLIAGNGLGTHGGEIVAKYFSSCYRLVYLDLTYNDIGASAVNLILLTIKKPLKLLKLKLYGNHFDTRTSAILRRLLDARVMPQECIDITVANDDTHNVIPFR